MLVCLTCQHAIILAAGEASAFVWNLATLRMMWEWRCNVPSIDWYRTSRGDVFLEILGELAKFKFFSLSLSPWLISAGPTHHPTLCQRCVVRRMSGRLNSRWLALDKQSQWHLTCRKSNKNSQERRAGAYRSSREKSLYLEKTEAEPTPWNSIVLWKLMVDEPFKKFPTFYGIGKFITVSPTWDHILGLINPHAHAHCYILTSLLILPSYLCLPGLFLRGSEENIRIYLAGPRKMRKPSGMRAGRLAAIRVWDLAEDE